MPTKIAWADESWNPIVGCSRVSTGCENCYAERTAHRLATMAQSKERYAGTTTKGPGGIRWTGKVNLVPHLLDQPLRWKKPRLIFVNSMSDLFHEAVPDDYIAQIFMVMGMAGHHIFQVLTKRPERMRALLSDRDWWRHEVGARCEDYAAYVEKLSTGAMMGFDAWWSRIEDLGAFPNVHLYVSTENQKTFDERVPILLQTPAAVRGISAEPLLGPIQAQQISNPDDEGLILYFPLVGEAMRDGMNEPAQLASGGLDHVIVGGESGHGARECDRDWIRSIVNQCQGADVPVFVKQMGGNVIDSAREVGTFENRKIWHKHGKGGEMNEWPAELRHQEPARVRTK